MPMKKYKPEQIVTLLRQVEVDDAVGVRLREIPFSPQRVLSAISATASAA